MKRFTILNYYLLTVAVLLFAPLAFGEEGKADNPWVECRGPGAKRYGIFNFHVYPAKTNITVSFSAKDDWTLIEPPNGTVVLPPDDDARAGWHVVKGPEDGPKGIVSHCHFPFKDDDEKHTTDPELTILGDPSWVNCYIRDYGALLYGYVKAETKDGEHTAIRTYTGKCVCGNSPVVLVEPVTYPKPLREFSRILVVTFHCANGYTETIVESGPIGISPQTIINHPIVADELESISIDVTILGTNGETPICEACSASDSESQVYVRPRQ